MDVTNDPDSGPVIKLPRGRGIRLSGPELFRIALTLAMLVAVVVLTKPCSNAVSTFVMGMDGSGQGSAVRKPGAVDSPAQLPVGEGARVVAPESDSETEPSGSASDQYERLTPGMTETEVRSAIERAKAKVASPAQVAPTTKPAPAVKPTANPGSAARTADQTTPK